MPIELILIRQLASYLVMPIFIVDKSGCLLFFNESAEAILGRRFEETGAVPKEELERMFKPMDETGAPLHIDEVPVIKAIMTQKPAHRKLLITGTDGKQRVIEATGFPLIGIDHEVLAGVAIFWETSLAADAGKAAP
jgi:PAS domain-containing protein